jgi:hypothetical protein
VLTTILAIDAVTHGFVRSATGKFKTFDPPGSASTTALVINLNGASIGYYIDASNVTHGVLRAPRVGRRVRYAAVGPRRAPLASCRSCLEDFACFIDQSAQCGYSVSLLRVNFTPTSRPPRAT